MARLYFLLLGSAYIKAARKTLMKLTPDDVAADLGPLHWLAVKRPLLNKIGVSLT